MKTKEFNFELPSELIAQTPLKNRDSSKLMILNKDDDSIEHKQFENIIDYLKKGDVLVLNDSRVIPARLYGEKEDTKANIEILLLNEIENDKWKVLAKPQKRLKEGTIINFGNGLLKASVLEKREEGITIIQFIYEGIFYEILDELGEMPLPTYIHEKLEDANRYQTVYSKNKGSVAAPTAGLHFTNELIDDIKAKGIKIAYVTLHVGLGTFRPVSVDDINNHKMHSEFYMLDKENLDIINSANRVICVGTTSVRTLETIASKNNGKLIDTSGWSDIFISPGYKFNVVNNLITNFHLPKSTLIMLISSLYDREKILDAYNIAVEKKYRFFSFGDSMFITTNKNDKEL